MPELGYVLCLRHALGERSLVDQARRAAIGQHIGDLGGIILFGSFLAWAVFDRISLKRREDPGAPPIPIGGVGNDLIAVAVGVVAYLALAFAFHPVVIGVPVRGS